MRLQGPDTNIIQFRDILRGFVEKIHNWNCEVNQENFITFKNYLDLNLLCLNAQIKQEITEHLQSLENEFKKFFLDLEKVSKVFLRNPFSPMRDITIISEKAQDDLLDLRNDSANCEMFMIKSLTQFWISMLQSYESYRRSVMRHYFIRFHLPL